MSIAQLQRMGITGTSGSLQRDFAIIKANLEKELLRIKHRTNKGLILAAIEVNRDMENTPPLIPIKYGNLRSSFFIQTKKNADASSKMLQVRGGKFRKADTPEILAQLKQGHTEMLQEAQSILAQYPIGVMMGFSAYYSAPVHEMTDSVNGTPINWSRPGSGPKFFQAALYRNIDKIITIVKTNAQVRP